MTTPVPFKVAFLPWAGLETEVRVGPVRFLPLEAWFQAVQADAATQVFWRRYAACHIDLGGQPIKSLACAVVDGATFGQISDRHLTWIRRACDAVAASYLLAGWVGRALPTNRRPGSTSIASPDHFQLAIKSFSPSDTEASITSGGGMSCWPLDELRLQRPAHIHSSWCAAPDQELLTGLGRIIRAQPSNSLASQIWASLEWLRLAYGGGDFVSGGSRLVMLMTAFEHLLADFKGSGHGGGEIKEAWKNLVQQHLQHERLKTIKHDFKRGGVHPIPIPQQWFLRFFDLRSVIVHGQPLKRGVGHYQKHPHLILAPIFFWLGLKARLANKGLMPSSPSDPLRRAMKRLTGQTWTKTSVLKHDLHHDCRRVYQALGWLKKR